MSYLTTMLEALKENTKMYEEEYHSVVHNHLLDKDYYLFRAKCADKFYWKHIKEGKVLDFGCGLGQNIFLHKDVSVGYDVSKFAIDKCREKGIETKEKFVKDEFDGVLCVHVLEHLKNPYETLSKIYNLLKENGRLVIVLPYSLTNKPVKEFKRDIAKHFYNWNFNSVNELLNDVGFKIKLNKFNYAYGYSRLYRLPFGIAIVLLKLLGRLNNRREMIIVVEK